MNITRKLTWAALVLGPIPLAWAFWSLIGQAPDPVAIHFDSAGVADGFASRSAFTASILVATAIGALVTLFGAWCAARGKAGAAAVITFCGVLTAWTAAPIGLVTATVHRNVSAADQARMGAGWTVLYVALVLVVSLVALGLSGIFAPREPSSAARSVEMHLADGQDAAYSGTTFSRAMVGLGCVLAIASLIAAYAVRDWFVAFCSLSTIVVLWGISYVRTQADRRGLTVRMGLVGWPRMHIPIDHIERAVVDEIVPHEWGGYGYRGSFKLMKRAAIVFGRREGIVVDTIDGKQFAATVDNPDAIVGVLNAYRTRTGV